MKKLFFASLALMAVALCPTRANAQDESEWVGIGTGCYQPGILDRYSDEYSEIVPAAVYESTVTPGKYKFVPTFPGEGVLGVYEIVVHTENPEKVWCENAFFFRGIMNFNTCHKVTEAEPPFGASDANYGKLEDGVISFTTPNSFLVMEMMGYQPSNINGKFALYLPGATNPGEDPIIHDTWEVMGMGKYTEGLLDCEYNPGVTWDVEIEKSVEHPGCYRLKPYVVGNPSCPNLPEVADTYLYIHAENEMEVYTSDFLILNSQGRGYKIQHRAVLEEAPDYASYGTLEDGVITFPANSHYATVIGVAGMGTYPTNTSGKATIALPGSDFKDWYVKAFHPVCVNLAGDGFCNFPFRIEGAEDVAGAALFAEAGSIAEADVDVDAYMSQGGVTIYPRDFFGFNLNMNFPLVADQYGTNRWTFILVPVDAQGQPHGCSLSTFFTPENDSQWTDYAEAELTDLILGPSYMSHNATYDVVLQQKKGSQGTFRVVNPYKEHPAIVGSSYMDTHSGHNHYLYIHAEDPDYVYVEESPMGLNMGFGDVIASSKVGSMLNARKSLDEIKADGTPAGKLEGDYITFPQGALCFFETEYQNFFLQPGDEGTLLHITKYLAGVEDVTVDSIDNLPATYYDLRGSRVENPVAGTLYIKVQGDKASKVIMK